jgi:hypothetical protein
MSFPLNLPVDHLLADKQNILIAGAGGGFDILAGLPLYAHLKNAGKNVHLANYSFVDVNLADMLNDDGEMLLDGLIYGTRGPVTRQTPYFPEGYLAQWFAQEQGEDVTIWMIAKEGVREVRRAYRKLIDHLKIDAIILCDGGVDSLMRGNEEAPGTLIEDTITITAVAALEEVPTKLLVAIGIGTEVEEGLCHHHFLENVAALAKEGGYYGSCALLPQMPVFKLYEEAAHYVFTLPNHKLSHIHPRIIPAVWGEFDNFNWLDDPRQPHIFVSPLMSLYWCFDVEAVRRRSLLADILEDEVSVTEAIRRFTIWYSSNRRKGNIIRPVKRLPLL